MDYGCFNGNIGTVKAQAHLRDVLFAGRFTITGTYWKRSIVGAVRGENRRRWQIPDEGTFVFLENVVTKLNQWMKRLYCKIIPHFLSLCLKQT